MASFELGCARPQGREWMDILNRIKRLVARGDYRLTDKATTELYVDGLTPLDAAEAILNAQAIKKVQRSRSRRRSHAGERLYVIEGFNYAGTLVYTKGTIKREAGYEIYYLFISSKVSTLADQ
jgi:hypothetical protein